MMNTNHLMFVFGSASLEVKYQLYLPTKESFIKNKLQYILCFFFWLSIFKSFVCHFTTVLYGISLLNLLSLALLDPS